ncbi:MAG: pantetheine-phosphate adenylyltransferase [Gemmatimonadetes bacterium]|nr:pantetheine-phosphate adenylyltransferase [Gemmatimonadota bacterium]
MSEERIAICPGSFDPITLGHEDIVRRGLRFADRVIVAVAHTASHEKRGLFGVQERVELIKTAFADEPRVEATEFQGLLVDFARQRGAGLVIRGLRAVSDFEYEFQMALMNRELSPEMETVFLATDADKSFLSATLVREIATLGGDVSRFVSPAVLSALNSRLGEPRT